MVGSVPPLQRASAGLMHRLGWASSSVDGRSKGRVALAPGPLGAGIRTYHSQEG
jgi:hypothetical protein